MNNATFSRRDFLHASCATTLAAIAYSRSALASAQSGVNQLRILCTGPAGSIPDTVARRVAEQLGSAYPQGAIIENKPGAAGQLAVNALKASPHDGSTLLLAQGAVATVYPYLYAKLAYDPIADLQPVSLAGEMTLALAVGPGVPSEVKTTKDFLAWMRANPKLANLGSPGAGTSPHLLEAMLFKSAKVEWQHVGYAGGPAAMVDLLGGQLAGLVLPEGLFRQHKATGKLRVLATSGEKRSSYFPDVPSLAEEGYRDLVVREWFAFFAPARTPANVIEAASSAVRAAVARPELIAAFTEMGMTATSSTPSTLGARISGEQRYWQNVIRTTGIRAE
jgi:tripartite-type tricarboxylate transporter receptor subunit TctC